MKIKIKFSHSKESKLSSCSPSTFHFPPDGATGPVLMRGEWNIHEIDLKADDVLEFATTKFNDEYDFKVWRGGKLLNADTFTVPVKFEKAKKK